MPSIGLARGLSVNERRSSDGGVPRSTSIQTCSCLIANSEWRLSRDVKLLSFGADEGGEEEEPVTFKKKPIVRPDRESCHQ